MLEEAAARGFYSPLFYRDLIGDPTGLSLPMFMEELFWGCAGIGLAIVMPALALSAIGQAASPEQMLQWAPECFGTPGDLKLAALAISEPEGGSDVRNLRTACTSRRRRLDHRRSQDVDRQRRHRQRARRQRRRRRGARPPRTGPVHRARRHPGPRTRPQARQARLPRVAHRRVEIQRCARSGREPARRPGQARAQTRQGARSDRGRQAFRLGHHGHLRADPADGRRSGTRNRQGRIGIRHRVRQPARSVRCPDHRQPGHRVPARRPGHRDRRGAPAHLAGLLDGRIRRGVRARRGLDGEAGRQRSRRPNHRARHPDDGRLGLHQGPSG